MKNKILKDEEDCITRYARSIYNKLNNLFNTDDKVRIPVVFSRGDVQFSFFQFYEDYFQEMTEQSVTLPLISFNFLDSFSIGSYAIQQKYNRALVWGVEKQKKLSFSYKYLDISILGQINILTNTNEDAINLLTELLFYLKENPFLDYEMPKHTLLMFNEEIEDKYIFTARFPFIFDDEFVNNTEINDLEEDGQLKRYSINFAISEAKLFQSKTKSIIDNIDISLEEKPIELEDNGKSPDIEDNLIPNVDTEPEDWYDDVEGDSEQTGDKNNVDPNPEPSPGKNYKYRLIVQVKDNFK